MSDSPAPGSLSGIHGSVHYLPLRMVVQANVNIFGSTVDGRSVCAGNTWIILVKSTCRVFAGWQLRLTGQKTERKLERDSGKEQEGMIRVSALLPAPISHVVFRRAGSVCFPFFAV